MLATRKLISFHIIISFHIRKAVAATIAATVIPLLATSETDNLSLGIPDSADQIVERRGYALGFSQKHKQARWVSYRLTANEVTNSVVSRADFTFEFDPQIKGGSATLVDYRHSGYGLSILCNFYFESKICIDGGPLKMVQYAA